MLLRLLAFAYAPVELAEAEVAVGDEGAHAARFGEGLGLSEVGDGLVNIAAFVTRGELAEKTILSEPLRPCPWLRR